MRKNLTPTWARRLRIRELCCGVSSPMPQHRQTIDHPAPRGLTNHGPGSPAVTADSEGSRVEDARRLSTKFTMREGKEI